MLVNSGLNTLLLILTSSSATYCGRWFDPAAQSEPTSLAKPMPSYSINIGVEWLNGW
jgi:hypothetical protein